MSKHDNEKGPEVFIALVGPAGTDLDTVFKSFKRVLKGIDYNSIEIRLSKLLTKYMKGLGSTQKLPEDQRIEKHMKAGDDFRRQMERGDALASLGILEVQEFREKKAQQDQLIVVRHAYIFNSLKHPDEVTKLKSVYGDALFVVSIHTPRNDRINHLSAKIAKSHSKVDASLYIGDAERIVDKDYKTSGVYSQNVMETFPLADFFIDGKNNLEKQVKRFIDLLFGNPFITPTIDEYGMFFAKAAALRSADLSRQVGAVIMTKGGEVISTGCNEVPEAGGGHAWEGSAKPTPDNRDFKVGHDANAVMKHEIVTEIFDALKDAGWLSLEISELSADDLMRKALYDKTTAPLKGKKVANIIEFGRIIHAEMSAITDASRRGVAIKGATLYCTTFPCHMCARHIIAAGLTRAVYIEPYEKSSTKTLYGAQIQFDDVDGPSDRVLFHPFIGISPTIYAKLFDMSPRKDKETGQVLSWDGEMAEPRIRGSYKTYLGNESVLLKIVNDKMVEVGLLEGSQVENGGPNDIQKGTGTEAGESSG